MRIPWWLPGVALAVLVAITWQPDVPTFGFLLDDGLYLSTAKQMAEGGGYRIASLPDQPWQTKYPPGYPWLLSLAWRAAPGYPAAVTAASWLQCGFWAGLVIAVFVYLQRAGPGRISARAPWSWGALAVLWFVWNPYAVFYARSLMTEACWMLVFLSVILAAPVSAPLAGVLAGLAFLVRTSSIVLLAAGPAWYGLRREWRNAALFTAAMLPAVAGWQWWAAGHRVADASHELRYYTDYFGYLASNFSLSEAPDVISKNAEAMLAAAGRRGAVSAMIDRVHFPALRERWQQR